MLTSILDNDLYKFTMQQYVLETYPDVFVRYEFRNRTLADKVNRKFCDNLAQAVKGMENLALTEEEKAWLGENIPDFSEKYVQYLDDYRYNADEVKIDFIPDEQDPNVGRLQLAVEGLWHTTILWEVPLMAIISEMYFMEIDTDWEYKRIEYMGKTLDKAAQIASPLAEFGTRRRRSYHIHEDVVCVLKQSPWFVGTSNVHFAHKFDCTAIGTMAHEFVMGLSYLESKSHPNTAMLDGWYNYYAPHRLIALTDTYGTNSFLRDFDEDFVKKYDGVRHDSGCPLEFADKIIAHYESLGINPKDKTIVFSDGLDVDICNKITQKCGGRIKHAFGIGTNLTNDKGYFGKALNIVIKLVSVDNNPVVKLSDNPEKAIGDPGEVEVMKTIHFKDWLQYKI